MFNVAQTRETGLKYFKSLYQATRNNFIYSIIKPLYDPMILFSNVDGSPLAAITLVSTDTNVKSLITERPFKKSGEADFQGFFNQDNTEFMIVLTNLHPTGYIKIDLLTTNTAVNEVDPGWQKNAINSVNEIQPLCSCEIKGNQKDSLSFILRAIKDNQGQKITVGQTERSSAPVGTYYYIAVTPRDNNAEHISLFADTYWKCVDFFFIRTPLNTYAIGTTESMRARDRLNSGNTTPPSIFNTSSSPGVYAISFNTSSSPGVHGIAFRGRSTDLNPYQGEIIAFGGRSTANNMIQSSYAAQVTSGRTVDVSSNNTGFNYIYDVPSNQTGKLCTICISISTQLRFMPSLTDFEIIEAATIALNELIQNGYNRTLINLKRYRSEICVICMDDDINHRIDCVFYQCGHECCHIECIDRNIVRMCFICRKGITAVLKI
jgi:hypothetical protein